MVWGSQLWLLFEDQQVASRVVEVLSDAVAIKEAVANPQVSPCLPAVVRRVCVVLSRTRVVPTDCLILCGLQLRVS